VGADFPIGK
jgi:hypothetical protein